MPPIESKGMVEGYEYGTAGGPINQRQATVRRATPWTDKPISLLTAESTPYTASGGNPSLSSGAPITSHSLHRVRCRWGSRPDGRILSLPTVLSTASGTAR